MERELSQFEEIVDRVEVDLGFDPQAAIQSQIDADRHLFGIQAVEGKIEREKAFLAEAQDFYLKRISALEKQQEFLRSKIETYLYALDAAGHEPKASTPHGTAFLVTRMSKHWNPDIDLVDWAESRDMGEIIQVKRSVRLTDLEKACKERDIKPPYMEEEVTRLQIRAAAKKK